MLQHRKMRCTAWILLSLLAACGAESPPPPTVDATPPPPDLRPPVEPAASPPVVRPPAPPPFIKHDPALVPSMDLPEPRLEPRAPREEYAKVEVFYATDRRRAAETLGRRLYRFGWAALALLPAILVPRWLRRRPLWTRPLVRIPSLVLLWGAVGYLAADGAVTSLRIARKAERLGFLYGGDPDAARGLEYGSCVVSVPPRHEVGELETPSLLRGEIFEDPYEHMVLWSVEPSERGLVFERMRARIRSSGQEDAFVFIHGYNVTFERAALRTAQIAWDLDFRGAPIFFSWSSQGDVAKYTHDEDKARDAVPRLVAFLKALHAESGARKIYLVAHSMGTRLLGEALVRVALEKGDAARIFHEVILAAPDINADTFRNDIAPQILRTAERVTLYASSNDIALALSEQVHGSLRAGSSGEGLVVVPGMDTIDVSEATSGHCYLGSNGRVLKDLKAILLQRRKAAERTWLEPRERRGERYWFFAAASPR